MIPVIAPGPAGTVFTAIASDCKAPLPQPLFTLTEMVPPMPFAVTVMLSVVLVPVQPPGRVQL